MEAAQMGRKRGRKVTKNWRVHCAAELARYVEMLANNCLQQPRLRRVLRKTKIGYAA